MIPKRSSTYKKMSYLPNWRLPYSGRHSHAVASESSKQTGRMKTYMMYFRMDSSFYSLVGTVMDNHEVASVETPAHTVTSVAAARKPLIDCHLNFISQASAKSLFSHWSAHASLSKVEWKKSRQSVIYIQSVLLNLFLFCHKRLTCEWHTCVFQQHKM